MRILNYGSLNIDHVYRIDHVVRPGETLSTQSLSLFPGGKGANQSCALGRAGVPVFHAGKIGEDGKWLLEGLAKSGVDTQYVTISEGPTGHAIIQVDKEGENAIFLFGGGNQAISRDEIDRVLSEFGPGDMLLLQNEINDIPYIMEKAHKLGMKICFNPAPFTPEVPSYPLELTDLLVVNETEGRELSGKEDEDDILTALLQKYKNTAVALTLGAKGVRYKSSEIDKKVEGVKAKVVDTTAAGDTFIGYFLAGLVEGTNIEESLHLACKAAAVTVSRPGAGDAIPYRNEL